MVVLIGVGVDEMWDICNWGVIFVGVFFCV